MPDDESPQKRVGVAASGVAARGMAARGVVARGVVASAALLAVVVGLLLIARQTARPALGGVNVAVSILGAVIVMLLLGSLYEWFVHRFLYHHPSRIRGLNNIFVIHEHGHHWHRFPPDRYVEAPPVRRIPVFPAAPYSICESPGPQFIAWAAQYVLYLLVAISLVFLPIWLITRNAVFTAAAVVYGLIVSYLLIRVHDVIHYPGESPLLERQRWFRFLDRHHFIHHMDNTVNLNFLLPLCDLLFGTLRTHATEREQSKWPAFEEAKKLPDAT